MSRFGDENEFMNDLSEMLEKRAKEVGNDQALAEVFKVLLTHQEYYSPR